MKWTKKRAGRKGLHALSQGSSFEREPKLRLPPTSPILLTVRSAGSSKSRSTALPLPDRTGASLLLSSLSLPELSVSVLSSRRPRAPFPLLVVPSLAVPDPFPLQPLPPDPVVLEITAPDLSSLDWLVGVSPLPDETAPLPDETAPFPDCRRRSVTYNFGEKSI